MHAQTILDIIGSISGILTLGTVLVAILVFFYRRGKADEDLVNSLKAITDTNKALADDYKMFRERTIETLHTHDLRITRLEPYSNGSGTRRR